MKKINHKVKKLKRLKSRKNPCDYEKADQELEQEFKILKKTKIPKRIM